MNDDYITEHAHMFAIRGNILADTEVEEGGYGPYEVASDVLTAPKSWPVGTRCQHRHEVCSKCRAGEKHSYAAPSSKSMLPT